MSALPSRLLYSATMSLDGFIAGPDGDMSWLREHLAHGPDVDALVARIGALLVGRRTFEGDDPNRGTDAEGAFGGRWEGPSFVLSRRPRPGGAADTTFCTDLDEAAAAARSAAGGRYVNVLGPDLARNCIERRLLDEVLVIVAPVLLGGGTRLFDRPAGPRVLLDPVDPPVPAPLQHWYRVRY